MSPRDYDTNRDEHPFMTGVYGYAEGHSDGYAGATLSPEALA